MYFSPKNTTFDPHAAKALNKKLWYLKDQGTVATTDPATHPTGTPKGMTAQKNRLFPQAAGHQIQTLIKLTTGRKELRKALAENRPERDDLIHRLRANLTAAGQLQKTKQKAAPIAIGVPAEHQMTGSPFHPQGAHLTAADQHPQIIQKAAPIVIGVPAEDLEIEKLLSPKINLIAADQLRTIKQAEVSAADRQGKGNLIPPQGEHLIAAARLRQTSAQKEVRIITGVIVRRQGIKNLPLNPALKAGKEAVINLEANRLTAPDLKNAATILKINLTVNRQAYKVQDRPLAKLKAKPMHPKG